MMTKKIKIIIAIILTSVVAITATLVVLYCNQISYLMHIGAPNRISIYNNNTYTNKVFDKGSNEYEMIYSSICDGCEQNLLVATFSGNLFKNVKISSNEASSINFKGIKVSFIYDSPQAVKYKKSIYSNNGENYWYQSLIFDINNSNKYQYSLVAIIPPEDSSEFTSNFSYNMHYQVYSNFYKSYNKILNLF